MLEHTELHAAHLHLAKDGAERNVLGIAAGADAHHPVHGRHARGIEQHPATTDPGFEDGVEILRRLIEPHIPDHQARRDVQRAAQRDPQMGEVAAHALALHEHFLRGGGRIGAAHPVFD